MTINQDSLIAPGPSGGHLYLSPVTHNITVAAGKTLTITTATGPGGLVKQGTGDLKINNTAATPNDYTGATVVQDGGLIFQNSAASSSLFRARCRSATAGATPDCVRPAGRPARNPERRRRHHRSGTGQSVPERVRRDRRRARVRRRRVRSVTGAGTLTLNGNVTSTAGSPRPSSTNCTRPAHRTFDVADGPAGDLIIDGVVTGGANAGLIKTGPGTLELTGEPASRTRSAGRRGSSTASCC